MTKYTTLDDFLTDEGIKAEVEASTATRIAELEAAELDQEALAAAEIAWWTHEGNIAGSIGAAIVAYNAHMRAKLLSEIAAADAPLLDGEPG